MVEEDKTKDVPVEPKDTQSQAPKEQPKEGKSVEIDFDALRKEIEEADKKLVSEDVNKLIQQERETAKKEAEKEFLVNQRLKEKEAEIEKLKNASIEEQKKAAEQLAYLKSKLDELVTTKQVVQTENPFKQRAPEEKPNNFIDTLDDKEIDLIEERSLQALLERPRERN